MFKSNKNRKDTDTSPSTSLTKPFKGGHPKTKSSTNLRSNLSDLNNTDLNDLHSLTSFNSFSSLNNVRSSNQNLKSPNQSWSNSLESLHSLPDNFKTGNNKNLLSFYNKRKNKLKSNNRQSLKKNQKNKFLPYLNDKSRSDRNYTTPPPIDASTIMEDDESEQVLNVPMLPAFSSPCVQQSSNKQFSLPEIPKPKSRAENNSSFNFPSNGIESTGLTELNEFTFPQNASDSFNETESNRIFRSTIDQDFNVNFSKDSAMSKGPQILELRKKKGILSHKKVITEMSSSDDDVSTEHETDNEIDNHFYALKQYIPTDGGDNNSIKSNDSHTSKKGIFRSIFRKRGLSFGSEKSIKLTTTNNSKDSENGNVNENENKNKTDYRHGTNHTMNKVNNKNDDEEIDNEESIYFNFAPRRKSVPIKEKIDEFSDSNSGEKDKSTTEKQTEFDDIDLNESNNDNDTGNEKHAFKKYNSNDELDGSNGNGEHFLKNVFRLDGLLGQGGLIPSLNIYNDNNNDAGNKNNPNVRRGDQVHDEENPPPNFQDEIKEEAQVLVGHMIRNPLDELKNSKGKKQSNLRSRRTSLSNRENFNYDNSSNNSTSDLNTTAGSSTGLFVPDRAHLPIDPFDDLQDVYNFSIDVPENVASKPRKYRAGIQSALFQLYNAHTLPSASTSNSSTTLAGQNYDENISEAAYDSEFNETINDLNMNIGDELRRNEFDYLDAKETLSSQLPAFTSKLQEITTDAETEVGKFSKKHRRAGSLQSRLFGSDAGNRFYKASVKSSTGNKKSDVSFSLPNFGEKPSTASDTEYEKKELQGYKNLKKRAKFNKKITRETTARITVHIADVLERQRFILTLCKAFMLYGAPTHRLEEYMSMTAQVLEIDGSFIYFPGCMLVSFGDLNARTSEMKLVRCAQGLDLGKLDEVHDVYKNVVHDRLGTTEGYQRLDEIMNRTPHFNAWWCIFFYAMSSLAVASWSFGGSWIDLPICFGIGGIIGFLQFVVCPKNTLYTSVFEVTSSIIASFIARAIGSINGGNTFCYAALVQSPLALILPGYIILCGSLELQSRNIVAGSVRMFYAFIYSLMLSFGITLGAALYGWIDKDATSVTTCSSNISPWFRFLFIPMFTIGIALTNQASWSQLPMMCVISGSGYVVTYFSSLHFREVTELNATLGCFIIGLVSNIYSRMLKSFNKYFTARGTFMTVSLMLPAIFVQVPSGIASQGSVFTGISTANNIVHSNSATDSTNSTNSLSFGMVMIQVALGISVGLYLSTILVYPFGKKRTGLFTL